MDSYLGRRGVAADGRLHLLYGKIEAARDQRNIGVQILHLLAQQIAGDGGIVVDQNPAFAVEDLAAGRAHRIFADAVGFGEYAIALRAQNLQPPHARRQNKQHKHDDVLRRMQLARGYFLIASVVAVGFGDAAPRGLPAASSLLALHDFESETRQRNWRYSCRRQRSSSR